MSKKTFGQRLGQRHALMSEELGTLPPEEGTGETPPEELVIDGAETVEGELGAAAEEQTEVETSDAEMTNLEADHEALESMCFQLAKDLKEGGLSPQSSRWVGLAINGIAARHGYIAGEDTPALLSIGAQGTAYEGTRMALLEAEGMLESFWAAIKEAFQKAYEAVKGWVLKMMDATPKVAARAADLEKKAAATTNQNSEKYVTKVNGAEALSIAGKECTVGQAVKGAEQLETISGYLTVGLPQSKTIFDALSNAIKGLAAAKATEEVVATAGDLAIGAYEEFFSKVQAKNRMGDNELPGEGYEGSKTDEMLGNACIFYTQSTTDKKGSIKSLKDLVAHATFGVGKFNPEGKLAMGDKHSFPTVPKDDVIKIAKSIAGACAKISAYKAVWADREKQFKQIAADGAAAVAGAKKSAEGENKAAVVAGMKEAVQATTTSWRNFTKFENQVIGYVMKTSTALFSLCDKSLAPAAAAPDGETKPA